MKYKYKEGWWETKDHRKLKIEDMDTTHIKNTIAFLKRTPGFYDEYYGYAWDPDSYDYDNNEHLVNHKIEELEYELKRRNVL